ncbi:MAG: hypothetical protein ACK4TA_16475 [Saprospiraceae bacterium]
MSATQIREELHRIIDIADDRMVTAVYAMMQNYLQNDESIVAYTTSGEPLTRSEFINQVNTAYEAAKQGKVVTTKDLLKEMENW